MTDARSEPAFLLDWRSAEIAAVSHMKAMGFIDAQLTPPGSDGGIDAQSSSAVAQVKFHASPIGRPDIQRLRGAAHDFRIAIFYSTGGYTREAREYASQADVALFQMDPYGICSSESPAAADLEQPDRVGERRLWLEELTVVRYRYAAAALGSDVTLFRDFALAASLGEEIRLYEHVRSEFQTTADEFRLAVEEREFERADAIFDQARSRITFLSWSAGDGLVTGYPDLESAISEGWRRDFTFGSADLVYRIATGVFELRDLLSASLSDWNDSFPDGVKPADLVDRETSLFAGMMLSVSRDETLLTERLSNELRASVRAGVTRGGRAAMEVIDHILALHDRLGLDRPRNLIALKLRASMIVACLKEQISASY